MFRYYISFTALFLLYCITWCVADSKSSNSVIPYQSDWQKMRLAHEIFISKDKVKCHSGKEINVPDEAAVLFKELLLESFTKATKRMPLIHRQAGSLDLGKGKLKNSDSQCKKQSAKVIEDADAFIQIGLGGYDEENACEGKQCVLMNEIPAGIVVDLNLCYEGDTEAEDWKRNVDKEMKEQIHTLLWSGVCPEENALLLRGKDGTQVSSVCVGVKCASDQKVMVRFDGQENWSECKASQEVAFEDLSVTCPSFNTVCKSADGSLTTSLVKSFAVLAMTLMIVFLF